MNPIIRTSIFVVLIGIVVVSSQPYILGRCEWQSRDTFFKCEPKCQTGWKGFYNANPTTLNHTGGGKWGSWDCMRGGTKRMCCLYKVFDNTWPGTWYSIKSLSRVSCRGLYTMEDSPETLSCPVGKTMSCDLQRKMPQTETMYIPDQWDNGVGRLSDNCSTLEIFGKIGTVEKGKVEFYRHNASRGESPVDTWVKLGSD